MIDKDNTGKQLTEPERSYVHALAAQKQLIHYSTGQTMQRVINLYNAPREDAFYEADALMTIL